MRTSVVHNVYEEENSIVSIVRMVEYNIIMGQWIMHHLILCIDVQ